MKLHLSLANNLRKVDKNCVAFTMLREDRKVYPTLIDITKTGIFMPRFHVQFIGL